jgi:hypothetical protein
LLLLTGYANDVLLGQPRACTGRVIGTVGTGDGALVKNACTCTHVYLELAVTIAHKIVTSLTTGYCIVSTCDEDSIHYPKLPSRGQKNGAYSFHGNPIRLYRNQSLQNCHLCIHDTAGCSADVDVVGQHDKFDV